MRERKFLLYIFSERILYSEFCLVHLTFCFAEIRNTKLVGKVVTRLMTFGNLRSHRMWHIEIVNKCCHCRLRKTVQLVKDTNSASSVIWS